MREDSWQRAKATFLELVTQISLSPDLTRDQSAELIKDYQAMIQEAHSKAIREGSL
jgi:hypothetical protein